MNVYVVLETTIKALLLPPSEIFQVPKGIYNYNYVYIIEIRELILQKLLTYWFGITKLYYYPFTTI